MAENSIIVCQNMLRENRFLHAFEPIFIKLSVPIEVSRKNAFLAHQKLFLGSRIVMGGNKRNSLGAKSGLHDG